MQITRIAWLLGYRDSSAFSHAFKRWTGRSPRQTQTGSRSA
jgi:AraC-like DNA-binding protein